ncbi:hypothetical protein TIFTF001_001935, partial [Ficus carica]
FHWISLACS